MTEAEHITGARNTIDPTKITTLSGVFSELNRVSALNMQCNIPAIVVKYDRKTHIATVRPLIKLPYNDIGNKEQSIEMPKMKVTVWRMSFGGFLLDMPLFPGDTGWLVASDWNTSLVKKENSFGAEFDSTKNKGPKKPDTYELHRYKNGFFIPDRWGEIDIADSDKNNIVIKSLQGDTYISISPSGDISIKNPNNIAAITVQGSITATGQIHGKDLTATGNISATGGADIKGTVNVGNIISTGDVVAFSSEESSIPLGNHAHIGNLGVETSPPMNGNGYKEGQVFLYPSPGVNGWDYSFFIATPEVTFAKPGDRVKWYFNSLRRANNSTYGYICQIIDGVMSYTSSSVSVQYTYNSPSSTIVTIPNKCKQSFSICLRATST